MSDQSARTREATIRITAEDKTAAAFQTAADHMKRTEAAATSAFGTIRAGGERATQTVFGLGREMLALAGIAGATSTALKSITLSADRTRDLSRMEFQLKLTKEETGRFNDSLRALEARTTVPFDKLRAATSALKKETGGILSNAKVLEVMNSTIAETALVTGAEPEKVAKIAGAMIRNFKIAPEGIRKQMEILVDTLGPDFADVGDQIVGITSLMKDFGYTGEYGARAMAAMIKVGRQSADSMDEAVSNLRGNLERLGSQGFEKLGITADEIQLVMKRNGDVMAYVANRARELIKDAGGAEARYAKLVELMGGARFARPLRPYIEDQYAVGKAMDAQTKAAGTLGAAAQQMLKDTRAEIDRTKSAAEDAVRAGGDAADTATQDFLRFAQTRFEAWERLFKAAKDQGWAAAWKLQIEDLKKQFKSFFTMTEEEQRAFAERMRGLPQLLQGDGADLEAQPTRPAAEPQPRPDSVPPQKWGGPFAPPQSETASPPPAVPDKRSALPFQATPASFRPGPADDMLKEDRHANAILTDILATLRDIREGRAPGGGGEGQVIPASLGGGGGGGETEPAARSGGRFGGGFREAPRGPAGGAGEVPAPGPGEAPDLGARAPETGGGGLARTRTRFNEELKDPGVRRQLQALTQAEVGGQGGQAEQAFMETVFNRAAARRKSLADTINDPAYYPPATTRKLGREVGERDKARMDETLNQVLGGSNVSKFATGNASGKVGFAGGRQTLDTGTGERFGIEGPDRAWADRQRAGGREASLTPPTAGTPQDRQRGGAPPEDVLASARRMAATGGPQAVKNYMRSQGYSVNDAWCGDFAAAAVRDAGGMPPKNPQIASNWRNYGQEVAEPKPGDIAVRRPEFSGRLGSGRTGAPGSHVTTVEDVNKGAFTGLGGNQGRSMRSQYPQSRYQFFRKPPSEPAAPATPAPEAPAKAEPAPAEAPAAAPAPAPAETPTAPAPEAATPGASAPEAPDLSGVERIRQDLERPIRMNIEAPNVPSQMVPQFRRATGRQVFEQEARNARFNAFADVGAA